MIRFSDSYLSPLRGGSEARVEVVELKDEDEGESSYISVLIT